METGKAIYKLLKDSSAVGAIAGDKIYPEVALQTDDFPLVIYTIRDQSPSPHKDGTSTLDTAGVEIVSCSKNYSQAMDLAIACRNAVDRVGGTVNGVEVQSIQFRTQGVEYDYISGAYMVTQNYDIRIQREGTARTYTPVPSVRIFNCLQLQLSAQQLADGSSPVTVTSTAARIPWSVEAIQTTTAIDLVAGGQGIAQVTNAGLYRVSCCVEFVADTNHREPHIYFQVESRVLPAHGTAYISGQSANDHSAACAVQIVNMSAGERISVYAYDDSGNTGNIYIESAVFDIEQLSEL